MFEKSAGWGARKPVNVINHTCAVHFCERKKIPVNVREDNTPLEEDSVDIVNGLTRYMRTFDNVLFYVGKS